MIPQHHLPHALLIYGDIDNISSELMQELRLLLCENHSACGSCPSCQLFASEAGHPDLMMIRPEGKLNITKIEAVREVIGFLEQSALRGGMRIVVFTVADTLNIASQNALLKSLEEPGEQTLLILVSDKPHLLLPTIKSRCQVIQSPQTLKPQDKTLTAALLNQPFDALQFIEKHKEVSPLDCVHAQMEIIHHQMQQSPNKALAHFYKRLVEKASLFQKKIALNAELMLFELALAWQRFFSQNTN